jgi:hypothetical protein
MHARMLAMFLLLGAGEALAIGPSLGVRLGTGPGFGSGSAVVEDGDFSSFSVGPALQIDMAVVAFEIDLLYTQVTSEVGGVEGESTEIDLPIILQLGLPVVPKLLSLKLGAGVQPRFRMSASVEGEEVKNDETESMVMYVPITLGARIGAGVVSLGLDVRYLYQLTPAIKDSDDRVNHLMVFGGIFF